SAPARTRRTIPFLALPEETAYTPPRLEPPSPAVSSVADPHQRRDPRPAFSSARPAGTRTGVPHWCIQWFARTTHARTFEHRCSGCRTGRLRRAALSRGLGGCEAATMLRNRCSFSAGVSAWLPL